MEKYLGLDIGEKKIGVAFSESGVIAREYGTLEIKDQDQAIKEILKIVEKEKANIIVVGLPLDSKGKLTEKAREIEQIVYKLRELSDGLPWQPRFIFRNEYLTTKEAERIMHEQRLPLGEIIKRTDSLAAKIILEEHLTGK